MCEYFDIYTSQAQIKFKHLIHGALHNVFLVLLSLSKL